MNRSSGWGLASLAVGIVLSAVGMLPRAATAEGTKAEPARRDPASTIRAVKVDLPDTVLASIGSNGRVVTVSAFVGAWSQAKKAAPPDSLTPEEARRFLGLMIDRELLAEAAGRESWTWTPGETARYRALRDRLMVGAALDSALDEARARWGAQGSVGPEALGVLVRDSTVARLDPRFDEPLLERLARNWSKIPGPRPGASVPEQLAALAALPRVDPADTGRVIAWSREHNYRVSELLASWGRLSIAYRPRIEDASQLRDLVKNGLFENALRRAAESRRLDLDPAVAEVLARAREEIVVAHLAEREVYAKIARDSVTLRRFYERESKTWTLPLRVRVIRLVLDDRAAAERMIERLHDQAGAETLAALARRQGLEYAAEWSLASDSAGFTAAMRAGTGAVIGPEAAEGGWRVARVCEVLPGRPRRFDEVLRQVEERWIGIEAERLTRELCDRLAKGARVVVNERALAGLRAATALGSN